MDNNDKSKRTHRGGSLLSGLVCGGKEAAIAAVEEGRNTENGKGKETRVEKVTV